MVKDKVYICSCHTLSYKEVMKETMKDQMMARIIARLPSRLQTARERLNEMGIPDSDIVREGVEMVAEKYRISVPA